jgi:transposase-like protein
VLVELGVVEQRYDAVKEVLEGQGTVTEVAERFGVPEPAQLAPALPGARDGRPGRPVQATEELPAPRAGPRRLKVIELLVEGRDRPTFVAAS